MSDNFTRFPSVDLPSAAEFRRFRLENSDLLDERYRREQALGSKERHIILRGTCGLCLLVTHFTSATAGGTTTDDGRLVPNWREQQVCGCRHGLNSRQRALLHLALSRLGAPSWCRSAILGREDRITGYLTTLISDVWVWPRFDRTNGVPTLAAEAASVHLVLSADHLHCVPPLDAALKEVARVLVPGGCFVFTVPFYFDNVTQPYPSQSQALNDALRVFVDQPVYQIGWDIIDRLKDAGFVDSSAHCYWSDEFGYLGTFNLIFLAYR